MLFQDDVAVLGNQGDLSDGCGVQGQATDGICLDHGVRNVEWHLDQGLDVIQRVHGFKKQLTLGRRRGGQNLRYALVCVSSEFP